MNLKKVFHKLNINNVLSKNLLKHYSIQAVSKYWCTGCRVRNIVAFSITSNQSLCTHYMSDEVSMKNHYCKCKLLNMFTL